MARKPRIVVAGQPHHIIVRGINREPVFYRDADYHYYLQSLHRSSEKNGCSIHAYVLMTNHVHLLLTPQNDNSIAKTIQSTGCRYVHYFNTAYERTGTLWEGRYKSLLIDSETYLFACQRYIEMNPVRAGMVENPDRYPWSSYRHNALGDVNRLVTIHPQYRSLGSAPKARQSAYRALFELPTSEEETNRIRILTNQEWVLGSNRFKDLIRKQLKRRIDPLSRGGDRRSMDYQQSRSKNKQH